MVADQYTILKAVPNSTIVDLYRKEVTMKCNNAGGAVYGFGVVGALVYYLQHATTFMVGLLGIVKAIVWPAMLAYKVFTLLHM